MLRKISEADILFSYSTGISPPNTLNQQIPTQERFLIIEKSYTGIQKVPRHTLRAGESAIYAVSRLSVYYSNSLCPRLYLTYFS